MTTWTFRVVRRFSGLYSVSSFIRKNYNIIFSIPVILFPSSGIFAFHLPVQNGGSPESGNPGDNARNEAFNGLVRHEYLMQYYFLDLKDAIGVLDSWKEGYSDFRPHGSLEQPTPARFRTDWNKKNDPEKLARCG